MLVEHDSLTMRPLPEDSGKNVLLVFESGTGLTDARSSNPKDGTANISRATTAQEVIEAQLAAVTKLHSIYKVVFHTRHFILPFCWVLNMI